MNIIVVLVMIAIVVTLLIAVKVIRAEPGTAAAFESRGFLFTPAERSFLGVLEQALDSRYRVFGKVRLGDIIKPSKSNGPGRRTAAQNKINQKHVDFVVCTANELALVGVLELDDQSHARAGRRERDKFVDQALAEARIPLLRFPAQKAYAVQEVRTRLLEMMNKETISGGMSGTRNVITPVNPAYNASLG